MGKNTKASRRGPEPKPMVWVWRHASPDMGGRRQRCAFLFMANLQISLDNGVERVKSCTEEKYELLSYWHLHQMDLCNLSQTHFLHPD